MTTRRKTMAETVAELTVIMKNRRSRIQGLTELVISGKASEADKVWIAKEISEHEKWIADTEKVIKNFYRPAVA